MKKHNFSAIENMIPGFSGIIANRTNLADAQLQQSVVLVNPELPKLSSGFENQVGGHTKAMLRADRDYEVIEVIERNVNNKLVVLKESGANHYHVVKMVNDINITETYGYVVEDMISDKKNVKKGEMIYAPKNTFDEHDNFKYGVDLMMSFASIGNLTYEDAIVISQSAEDKLASYSISTVDVSVNENNILLNLYGTRDHYKAFPNIGEKLNNQIICGRRKISYLTSLLNLNTEKLTGEENIDTSEDTIFYEHGSEVEVVDIEVFSNKSIDHLSEVDYNDQIIKILKDQNRYYSRIRSVLGDIIENPLNTTSGDFDYEYYNAISVMDPNLKWMDEKEFENLIIRFKMRRVRKMDIGNKLTNRYGSKGVKVVTLPDEEMPITSSGVRLEAFTSPLSPINRTNTFSILELELNFASRKVVEFMQKNSSDVAISFYLKYLKIVNANQHDIAKKYIDSLDSVEPFLEDLYANGIYLQILPFYHDVDIDALMNIHKLFEDPSDYEKETLFINGHELETKYVVAPMHFITLKQYAFGKFSARGTGGINMNGVPHKTRNFKFKESLHSTTPIRVGEMENGNMMLLKDVPTLMKFIKTYSSDSKARKAAVSQIVEKGFVDSLDIDMEATSNSVHMVNEYFRILGLESVE